VRAIAEIVAALVKSVGDGQDVNLNHIKTEVRTEPSSSRPSPTRGRSNQLLGAGSPQAWPGKAAEACRDYQRRP
jgi:hypothetical protein